MSALIKAAKAELRTEMRRLLADVKVSEIFTQCKTSVIPER